MTRLVSAFLFVSLLHAPAGAPRTMLAGASGDASVSGRIIRIVPNKPPGKLKVQEKEGLPFIPATEGMTMQPGYLLILEAQATAQVSCADNSIQDLVPGPQPCPCKKAKEGVFDGKVIVPSTRGTDTIVADFPVLLAPRSTLVLSRRPTIRWSALPGATARPSYRVSLYDAANKLFWSEQTTGGESLPYPADKPPLSPGKTYRAVVAAGGKSSDQEGNPSSGFTLLSPEQADNVRAQESKIDRLNLSTDQKLLLTCDLYAGLNLYAEATEMVAQLARRMREPAIFKLAGDLYRVVGLDQESKDWYLRALSLPQVGDDFDFREKVHAQLAGVYEDLREYEKALVSVDLAIEAAEKLNDAGMVETLKQKKTSLSKHLTPR